MFAPAPFSLALSYNRLVFTTADLQEIGRNHSGATVPRKFSARSASVVQKCRSKSTSERRDTSEQHC